MAGTWLEATSVCFFLGQNFRIFVRKSVFCYRTPDFVNGPFLALGDSFDLAPSDPFLNFSFPSYGNFREGDPPTQQKVLPHLTVRALTDSNSPSALSARAGLYFEFYRNDFEICHEIKSISNQMKKVTL